MDEQDKDNMENASFPVEYDFQKAFGWYLVVNRIAGNDFTKHDYVYQKGIMEVLNQLAFLISYDKEQIRLQKQAQNSNR